MPEEWPEHFYRVGTKELAPPFAEDKAAEYRKEIEPWLSAVFQSEHFSLLVGSGLTKALCLPIGASAADMSSGPIECQWKNEIEKHATKAAEKMGRGQPNIEDRFRSALQLLQGIEVRKGKEHEDYTQLKSAIDSELKEFLEELGASERDFINKITEWRRKKAEEKGETKSKQKSDEEPDPEKLLVSFLLSFASRTPSRERLHIFTTNYERFIEYGCDKAGLRIIDRFVGIIEPIFRTSRIDVDMHYNPPGIRGEPRYLEGVIRLTKLHGSIDWHMDNENRVLKRYGLPFGPSEKFPGVPNNPIDTVTIYPNAAKDVETLEYPYAELFRDFAAAVCRPNSALVTYGYGFGDDHINRVISDMLTIPSTHLVIISYGTLDRVWNFCERYGHKAQISLLLGEHFGNLPMLVKHYLPKAAIDRISIRENELKERRGDIRRESQERPEKIEP